MRIVYVNKVWPLTTGGAELRLWELARGLAARGHDVSIVCGRNRAGLPSNTVLDGVRLRTVRVLPDWAFRLERVSFFLSRYLFYGASVRAIAQAVRDADIVVDCATPVVSAAQPLARLAGIPAVVTVYETFGWRWFKLKGPVTALLGFVGELALRALPFDRYVTTSRSTVGALAAMGKPLDRIHFTRSPVGVRAVATESTDRDREVVCLGRLVRQKNVIDVLHAWAQLPEPVRQSAVLRVIGEGPDLAPLRAATRRLGIEPSVRFDGAVSDEAKWSALRRARALVTASLQEGFGIVVVEALAVGTPVVAYAIPAFVDLLDPERNALLEPVGDTAAMASALETLLTNDAVWAEMSAAASASAERFRWEAVVADEEAVLVSTVSAHPAA